MREEFQPEVITNLGKSATIVYLASIPVYFPNSYLATI